MATGTWPFLRMLFGVGCLLGSIGFAHATPAADWLQQQSQSTGVYQSDTPLATDLQATSEAVVALEARGLGDASDVALAQDYLDSRSAVTTEELARRIRLDASLGEDPAAAIERLRQHQNRNGGFGDQAGYTSTVLDTAWALEALAIADAPDSIPAAVGFLLDRQQSDGSWFDPGVASAHYTTALTLRALGRLRDRFNLDVATDAAHAYLLNASDSTGAIGVPHETAAAILALAPMSSSKAVYADVVDSLTARQRADGSWSGSVFTTALAIQALALAEQPQPNPELGSIELKLIDVETGVSLEGIEVALGGNGNDTVTTDSDGVVRFDRLPAGDYVLDAMPPDYSPLHTETSLGTGESKSLGTIGLLQSTATTNAAIQGTITDADTGAPIADAGIHLSGADTASTSTDVDGRFLLDRLVTGEVTVRISAADHAGVEFPLTLLSGSTHIVSRALVPAAGVVIAGTVTADADGQAVSGATVSVSGASSASIVTDTDGTYELTGLPSGSLAISVSHTGFEPVMVNLSAQDGQRFEFSPSLVKEGETPPSEPAGIRGIVVDAVTGMPIDGASLELVVDGASWSTTSDGTGAFQLESIGAGIGNLSASANGYRASGFEIKVVEGVTLELGELALVSTDPDAATANGVLLDSITNEPLANMNLEVEFEGDVTSLVSDADGQFSFNAPAGVEGYLRTSPAGYRSTAFPLYLDVGNNELGQIRVRPEGIDNPLPDLTVACVHGDDLRTGDDPIGYSGMLPVDLRNLGIASTSSPFSVSAFADLDRNGTPNPGDVLLGEVSVDESVTGGGDHSLDIPIAGEVSFRDAPITVRVDSDSVIAETNEQNNVAMSPTQCVDAPVDFADLELAEKWHWAGWSEDGRLKHVQGPVILGQFTDDNGDGHIDGSDVPDLVFGAGRGPWGTGRSVLVAVDGATGTELWSRRDIEPTQRGPAATGDIDEDGLYEIIVLTLDGTELIALEHDGTTKWRAPTETKDVNIEGGAAIANIDGIGPPEIIYARSVYNADGTLRWQGQGDKAEQKFGPLSLAADINLDGKQEVIAGRTVYRHDGTVLWEHASSGDGFNAVGNFDADDEAEIVLVQPGPDTVTLIDSDGSTIWGPVALPGSGGGPPTIADVDVDGEPEIGIATSARFLVLETDGSLKWEQKIRDGSARTGSTMFDFNDDGRPELLQNDEVNLRIFDGPTGEILVEMRNRNTTTIDYPVVADVDGDKAAEIVTGSSWQGDHIGVRVFEPVEGNWAPTRSQWNQHSYHITNIHSDGSIPLQEPPSWLAHNTYRLNRFVEEEPLARSDLSVSRALVRDDGIAGGLAIIARVGNAGSRKLQGNVEIGFHDGDPGLGGVDLGVVTFDAGILAPGEYEDIALENIVAADLSGADLFITVDVANAIGEFRDDNNSDRTPAEVTSSLGSALIGSDAPVYAPAVTVLVNASGTNEGTFAGDFQLALHVEDDSGLVVADLGETDLGTLASGEGGTATATWSTQGILSGTYELVATLYGSDGSVADGARTSVVLQPTASGGPAASLRTAPDAAVYGPNATVAIQHLVRNVSPNAVLADARLTTVVIDPDGMERSRGSVTLDDLAASAQRERLSLYILDNAPEGTWTVRGVLTDGQGTVLAQDEGHFDVVTGLLDQLSGQVSITHSQRYVGQSQTCSDTLVNEGEVVDLEIRRLVLDRDRAIQIHESSRTVSLAADETRTLDRSIGTGTFEPGLHTCLLQVEIDGQWVNLDSADFQLDPPPIGIEGTLEAGERGRLLVLLDPPVKEGQKAEDPHGPKHSPSPSDQRAWLEDRLDEAGWLYTIVTDGEAFAEALRSDGYVAVALFSEQVKIAEADQRYLIDAVEHDALGLFVAGMHDRRNGRVESALGLKSKGKLPHVDGLYVHDSEIATADAFEFAIDNKPLRLDLQGARTLADYTANRTDKGKGGKVPGPGLTVYRHGNGHSIDAGFDLLLQGTVVGDDNRYSELLLSALDHIHPDDLIPAAGHVWPLHLELVNEGLATPGRVVLPLPDGISVVDPGGATVEDGTLIWPFTLDIDERIERDAWIRLPAQSGPVELQTLIQTGTAPDWADHRTVTYTIDVD